MSLAAPRFVTIRSPYVTFHKRSTWSTVDRSCALPFNFDFRRRSAVNPATGDRSNDDRKMLREIHGLTDDPPAKRRWFHDDFFDLFVWQAKGEVTLFQLCYGIDSSEHALVWDRQRGFFH